MGNFQEQYSKRIVEIKTTMDNFDRLLKVIAITIMCVAGYLLATGQPIYAIVCLCYAIIINQK